MAIIITCLGINKNNLWFLNLGVTTNRIKNTKEKKYVKRK